MSFIDGLFSFVNKAVEIQERREREVLRDMDRELSRKNRRGECSEAEKAKLKKIQERRAATESRVRRTDRDFENIPDTSGKGPEDYQYRTDVLLSEAVHSANSNPGVYILYLDGQIMKCGRASYAGGIHWRFQQYYSLKYDDKAQHGNHWAINEENRDRVVVSWQCCPPAYCGELEYKLFRKYGKGPWAKRAPVSCNTNRWELLI